MVGTWLFALIASVTIGISSSKGYVPVYGFEGAMTAVSSGKTLHYYIRLNKCIQRTGRGYPEYAEPFGSHVTKWRSFNDKERAEIPYLIFHEQIPVLNRAGNLEQLSRDIRITANGSVTVTTAAYSADYSLLSYEYEHECTMSTAGNPGDIDFQASATEPVRLNGFVEIVDQLREGEYLKFNAMTFQCPGGTQHTFSGLGGHIPNYEFKYDSNGDVGEIKVFVQTTYHYALLNNYATVIDFTISRNNSVTIVDTRNSLPNYIKMSETVTVCPLEFGPPGGSFSVFL